MAQQRETLSVHELKVDQTALLLPGLNRSLFVSNINIPERYLDATQLEAVASRVRDFIINEYHGITSVKFQVCAAYELVHQTTGTVKYFHGSFVPGGNQSNLILPFRDFGPNFVREILSACQRQLVIANLSYFNVDTDWKFDNLLSVIVCVQANVPHKFTKLVQRGLALMQGNGRQITTRRITKAFPLP